MSYINLNFLVLEIYTLAIIFFQKSHTHKYKHQHIHRLCICCMEIMLARDSTKKKIKTKFRNKPGSFINGRI
uniref:Uncharacterized protein n=1 Tax=Octopus bimaculoides TaxID=37653 RepID=A0A0L8HLA4_OCTBM